MSDEITENSLENENTASFESAQEIESQSAESFEAPKEETVSYDSYQKVLNQRKADQKKARQFEEELRALREQLKAQENAKLEEKQEYKKLYEAQKAELDAIKSAQAEKDRIMVEKEKQSALVKELGGLKRDEYIRFADLKAIVIDDTGEIDMNSVRMEANRFRQSYGDLIKTETPVRVNSQAPSGTSPVLNQEKSAKDMSANEREAIKRQILMNQLKK